MNPHHPRSPPPSQSPAHLPPAALLPAELRVRADDVVYTAVRAQGAGGQNVNKVSNAVQLRFDIRASRLPEAVKARLLALPDQRISADGQVVIKAQTHRSLPLNKADALRRLQLLVLQAAHTPRRRVATRPSKAARQERVDSKLRRGQLKASRGTVDA